MTANTQPTETKAQTTNGSFQTDVSALQETTERAVEILDSHGEPVTIARLVGTVVRLGGARRVPLRDDRPRRATAHRRGVWGCRPMSTNAEDFRASFERARAMEVDR